MLPAISTVTINDILPDVTLILQNRTDISKYNPASFARKAIQELTLAYPFEELRVVGPRVTLTPNQYQYPVSFFLNAGDDYSQIQGLCVFTTPQVAFPLKYDTPTGIQTILFIPGGLPSKWTRFGQYIWIGTQPALPYAAFMLYQKRHPFESGTSLGSSIIMMPPEWLEIVQYATAYRLAAGPLRWSDMAKDLHMLLYGDPNDPSQPGLIKRRVHQQEMDERLHSRRVNVINSRY
jgi:hypothetical protein